jgi:hypothetical protein
MEQQLTRPEQDALIHKEKLEHNKKVRDFRTLVRGICRDRGVATAKYQLQYLKENPSAIKISNETTTIFSTNLPHADACAVMEDEINKYIRVKVEERYPDPSTRNQKRLD